MLRTGGQGKTTGDKRRGPSGAAPLTAPGILIMLICIAILQQARRSTRALPKGCERAMRIKLAHRRLPDYTRGEELFNMISHIVGGAFAILSLVLCVVRGARQGSAVTIVSGAVYGFCMLLMYSMSSIYHGLRPPLAKKVLQVLDHCAIYFMIAGTYTPILLVAVRPLYPALAWSAFGVEWGLTALAVTLTAIDLRQYRVFSMVCYIVMGWGVAAFFPQAARAMTETGFYLLLAGGVCYTAGAVLYGVGSKRRYFHCAFHVFVLAGSVLHFLAVYLYAL